MVKKVKDPYVDQEAEKYGTPIASRLFILEIVGAEPKPLPLKGIIKKTGTKHSEEALLQRRINAMVRDGQLMQMPKGYCLAESVPCIEGVLQWRRNGDAICVSDEGADSITLMGSNDDLFPGDRLRVQLTRCEEDGTRFGIVQSVLERVEPHFVGTYQQVEANKGFGTVEIFHRSFQAPVTLTEAPGTAPQHGDYVVVGLLRENGIRQAPRGRIIAHLGSKQQPGIETDVACRQFELPTEWPAAVEAAAATLGTTVPQSAYAGRADLRAHPFVTIDGEDARDFDDALYCAPRPRGGWTLWVAIADVSTYVLAGSPLDQEAYHRGTSVYFPNRVVPMLPEALSNELCSLKPDVDRLALVCEMTITAQGKVTSSSFCEAVIRSHARLTYSQVQAVLDGDARANTYFAKHVAHIQDLQNLFNQLIAQRKARGAIDFETVETRIDLSDTGDIVAITPMERQTSHRIVEECMLSANVCAAQFLDRENVPTVYRVHAAPASVKWQELRQMLREMGVKAPPASPSPLQVTQFLSSIRERPDYSILQTMLLRSMSQAIYTPINDGHFGLAYASYLHFTSPIRRYPDLLVHRLIRHALHIKSGKARQGAFDHLDYEKIAAHCSYTERRADEASRDVQFALKCRYMMQHLGEVFAGTVVGVTHFGLFVQLDSLYIEGLLHISELHGDYYTFDPKHLTLTGGRQGMVYRLGMKLQVRVVRVSVEARKIDLQNAVQPEPSDDDRRHGRRSDHRRSEPHADRREGGPQKNTRRRRGN